MVLCSAPTHSIGSSLGVHYMVQTPTMSAHKKYDSLYDFVYAVDYACDVFVPRCGSPVDERRCH
jgi:hypothetical protein